MSKSNYSQADMIVIARRFHYFATLDLADFTAFDASIDAAYLAAFGTAITAAENHPDDETVLDIQRSYTATLEAQDKLCRKAYQRLKLFVEKAFPTNTITQDEFGFNDYKNVDNVGDLMKFMAKLVSTANKYSTNLVAAAYPATDIAHLAVLQKDLTLAMTAQDAYKNERAHLTKQRDELLSAVYDYVVYLGKIGKIIYEDNRPQYIRYLLPKVGNTSAKPQHIASEARIVVFANVTADDYYTLRVLANGQALKFYVAPNGSTSIPTNAVTLMPSATATDFSIDELGFDPQYTSPQSLFVYNPNTQEVGYTAEPLT